jgi:hypothetical protein
MVPEGNPIRSRREYAVTGSVHRKSTFDETDSEPITEGALVMTGAGEVARRGVAAPLYEDVIRQ